MPELDMRILIAGALGEVGRSISTALVGMGHSVVPVSSRAPLPRSSAISLSEAANLMSERQVDLVVIASSQGDRRGGAVSGKNTIEVLGPLVESTGTPAVLLSTLRVLEGYSDLVSEHATPKSCSDYGLANSINERLWLRMAGETSSVLRISNYFCLPAGPRSPQAQLLPWSLLSEFIEYGTISVKSPLETTREFVSPTDLAKAIEILAVKRPSSRVCSTLPGYAVNLGDIVSMAREACTAIQFPEPTASFGVGQIKSTNISAGWLVSNGWVSELQRSYMVTGMMQWLAMFHGGK